MKRLLSMKVTHQEKKKEERWLLKNTRVIILAFRRESNKYTGEEKRILIRWDLGKVAETVTFFVGEETSVKVEVTLLHLPLPKKKDRGDDWAEWQANDCPLVPVPEDEDPLFRDYRMLMRLDSSSPSLPFSSTGIAPMAQFLWVEGVRVTVPYLDIIRQATYSEWRRLLVAVK